MTFIVVGLTLIGVDVMFLFLFVFIYGLVLAIPTAIVGIHYIMVIIPKGSVTPLSEGSDLIKRKGGRKT